MSSRQRSSARKGLVSRTRRLLLEALEERCVPTLGSITGQVYDDHDGNAAHGAAEAGLPGWTVYLDANSNGQFNVGEASALTDSAGQYTFTGLNPASYVVRIVPQGGWQKTTPPDGYVATVPAAGGVIGDKDFGEWVPRPNLRGVPGSFRVTETAPPWGGDIHLSLSVTNTGVSPASPQTFGLRVYLSADSTISDSDYPLVGGAGFAVPAKGGVVPLTATITLPASSPFTTGGPYYVGMILDPEGAVAEYDEGDNRNVGDGIDRASLAIVPPVALVSDSSGASGDRTMNFGAVVVDGPGGSQAVQTITLTDGAALSRLAVRQGGVRLLDGSHFHVLSILSNKFSQPVNPDAGPNLLMANGAETWTIQVAFDPAAAGAWTDTLQILTDDPANPVVNVALGGSGTPVPNLTVSDSHGNAADREVNFGDVSVDGIGAATVTLSNTGSGALTFQQGGITLPAGPFRVTGITSSTRGAIDLTAGPATIAPGGAETWAVSLAFDPAATGLFQETLTVRTDDPDEPAARVTLMGTGKTSPRLRLLDAPGAVEFGEVSADGPGRQGATRTVQIRNAGQLPLHVAQGGVTLAGSQFQVVSVTSDTQGEIDLGQGPATLAPDEAETWSLTLRFDPTAAGASADTLRIASDDPTNPTAQVSLQGSGLDQPLLAITDLPQFTPTLTDGLGGQFASRTVQLTNVGTQPLTVGQNGITLADGTNYRVAGIVSSTAGAINLASGSATLAALGAETWTVTLTFDPRDTGERTDVLTIVSNDPARPSLTVGLSGQSVVPSVTAAYPRQGVHASAGRAYHLSWDGAYAPGTGTYSVYYDTDRDAAGLVPIATGLPQSRTAYDWQVPASLVGGTYTVFVALTDGGVTGGSYAVGSLTVDAAGSDRMLSAPVTDQANYTLTHVYNGVTYTSTHSLSLGDNALYPVGGGAALEYHVTLAPTLVTTQSIERNELGNITSITDSAGQTIAYQYDQLSQVTSLSLPDETGVDYRFDPNGNLLSLHGASGWELFGYDAAGRLTSVTYSPTSNPDDPAALRIGYEYDLVGLLTARVYPGGTRVEYAYDVAGRMTRLTEKAPGQPDRVTTYAYSPDTGLLITLTRPNDTQTTYGYDTSGRLTDIVHRRASDGALLLSYDYTLDASGRRVQVVTTTPVGATAQAFLYDGSGQLTQVTYSADNGAIEPTDKVVRYAYDGNGNRLSMTTYAGGVAAGATQALAYVYGTENRLLSVTDQSGVVQARYYYDWRGNRVAQVTPAETTQYGYDARNLLTSVDDGITRVEYTYDGAGRRVAQSVNGKVTRFVVDPTDQTYQTLEERDSSGALTANYIYGLGRVSGTLAGLSGPTYYLEDSLDSVGGLADAAGHDLGTYSYDAFGQPTSVPAGVNNPFAFGGESFDRVTGLVYLRARYYDPTTGTFLSRDPNGLSAGLNPYTYAHSDPVNNVDPSGQVDVAIISQTSKPGDNALFDAEASPVQGIKIHATDAQDAARQIMALRASGTKLDNIYVFGHATQISSNGPIYQNLGDGMIDPAKDSVALAQIVTGAKGVYLMGCYVGSTPDFSQKLSAIGLGVPVTAYKVNVGAETAKEQVLANNPATSWQAPFVAAADTAGRYAVHGGGMVLGGLLSLLGTKVNLHGFQQWPTVTVPPNPITWEPQATIFDAVRTEELIPVDGIGISPISAALSQLGGVLIDKAAQLVGSSLTDIAGAAFDPVSHQVVFLGTSDPAAVRGVNLDFFTTAIQSVYGSAVPPYVTLDPPASLVHPGFDVGDGDGVLANGKSASLMIHYKPYAVTAADDMTLSFLLNGQPVTVRIDAYPMNIFAGDRRAVGLTTLSVTGAPAGFTVTMSPKNTFGGGSVLTLNQQGQDSYWAVNITNASGVRQSVTNLRLVTDLQHRKFGGRVDNTRLGWVMEEADRVAKGLAAGKDPLTGEVYDSNNGRLPAGFRSMLERFVAANRSGVLNNRIWFTPNEETLKRYVDPTTGKATVVFDRSSVKLNTESLLLGQPEDPEAKAFVEYFTANYDQFANIDFPVHDPDDPTGTRIIQVKIFEELRDAMKAVALARFFRDNNVPLDTWWINSWKAPTAYIPETIPTLTNSLSNGSLTVSLWGGVQIQTPNQYVADDSARVVANAVLSQRTPVTGDLAVQSWDVSGTPAGDLKAVAASFDAQRQDANVTLAATDLSFASPGGRQLSFGRTYNSGYLRDDVLGLGWQAARFELQFQYPSLVDDHGLMRDASGERVAVFGADSDTRLHGGEVRLVDHASGAVLNFLSSLTTTYALDAQGNPVLNTAGLGDGNVPTFTAGQFKDGTTLVQNPVTKGYRLTSPGGGTLVFDADGKLLTSTDAPGNTITYSYSSGRLDRISDSAGQALTITYNGDGRMQYVAGPDASATPLRRVAYVYDDAGRLVRVDSQALQADGSYATSRGVQYQYNADGQISGVVGPDGITSLTNTADLRGRSTQRQDALGNAVGFSFTQDAASGGRTTRTIDLGSADANDPTAQGLDALRYFAAGSSSVTQVDASDRTTRTVDAFGNATSYGYSGDSLLPTSVTLPTPGRPSISIERNALNLPTVIRDPANAGGAPVRISYNEANLPSSTTDAKGRVTTYTYTAWNAVKSVTVGAGTELAATTKYNYNARKLLESIVDPMERTVVTYGYDELGRVTSVADGAGVATRYDYDALGRLKRVYDPRLTGPVNYTEYTYNDNDQVTRVATPTGDLTYEYDAAHRLASATDLNGNTTRYTYDPTTGALLSVAQGADEGATTRVVYDRRGSVALVIAPNGTRTAFRYDVAGRPTATIEDDGALPGASLAAQPTSATSVRLSVTASEPVLVATLKYWADGQSADTAVSQAVRLDDQSAFTFDVDGLAAGQTYRYELTLTDRVGLIQTLPQGVFSTTPIVLALPADQVVEATATGGANVAFTAEATGGSGETSIIYLVGSTPVSSGAFFALGTTTVTVRASDASGNQVTGSFRVTVNAAVPDHLAFSTQSLSSVAGAAIRPAVTVQIVDRFGNVTPIADRVSVGLASNATGAKLSGATVQAAVNGTATFADLSLDRAGSYTLFAASTGGLAGAVSSQVTVAAASYFLITVNQTTTVAGQVVTFTVTAYTPAGARDASYLGTVRFTSTDALATLPAEFAFTAADAGAHTFSVVLGKAGYQSVTATDVTKATLTRTSVAVLVNPAQAAGLTVVMPPPSVVSGVVRGFTVTAVDAYGNRAYSYAGRVHFTSSDAEALLPLDYTFTPADAGAHVFPVTLLRPGTQSLAAVDVADGSIVGRQDVSVLSAATYLTVTAAQTSVVAGGPLTLTVTARDAAGRIDTRFVDTVRFTSSDPLATLPAEAILVNGIATFTVTLKSAGARYLTVTDAVRPSVLGYSPYVTVNHAAPAGLTVVMPPPSVVSGVARGFTVTAVDAYGNRAYSYVGRVHFTSSDAEALLPLDYTFTPADAGAHVFPVTLLRPGTQSLAAADVADGSIVGRQDVPVLSAATYLTVTVAQTSVVAGGPLTLTVTARDAAGRVDTRFVDTVRFTSSDPLATLPAEATLVNGIATFTATLRSAGARYLTVTDAARPSVLGYSPYITVNHAAPAAFSLTGLPSSVASGTARAFTVTALDAYGNRDTGYTGKVHFSSTQPHSVLPADFTFAPAYAGAATFYATLNGTGLQSLTVSDGTISGAQAGIQVTPATTYLVLSPVPATLTAGQGLTFTVTALNALGQVDQLYDGTVRFTSTDPRAELPADYTFGPSDGGIRAFTVPLKTAGYQTVRVADVARAPLIATTSYVNVTPAAVSRLSVTGFPSPALSGASRNMTVTAVDAYGNRVPGYAGRAHFTSSDAQATLPADYTFTAADAGVHVFPVTLRTVGSQSLQVADLANVSLAGAQSGIQVGNLTAGVAGPALAVPGQPLTYTLSAAEDGLLAGTAFTYQIDWDGNGVVDQTVTGPSGLAVTHVYPYAATNTVKVTARDASGNVSPLPATRPVTVQPTALAADPADPARTALYVGGTLGNDLIEITPADASGTRLNVTINGVPQSGGPFAPTGRLLVYGQAGYDTVKLLTRSFGAQTAKVAVPAVIDGGAGNDTLSAAGSSVVNVLVGGDGDDTLTGGDGRSLLIGGAGSDTLYAGTGGDVLVGGGTSHDAITEALLALAAEWGRTDRGYLDRVRALLGDVPGLNGDRRLDSAAVSRDSAIDRLFGAGGMDWFWFDAVAPTGDEVRGYSEGEAVMFS